MKFEWKPYKLKDLLSCIVDNRGKTPPTQDQGYPLLEINAVSTDVKYPLYDRVKKYVCSEVFETKFRSGHPKIGDILIPTVGTLGAVSYVNRENFCIAQNLIALRVNTEICDSQYLYYYLCNPITRLRLLNLDIGAVQPSIKVPHLLNLDIELPPLKVQKNIGYVLSVLDDKIAINIAMNNNLRQQTMELYKQRFIDNPEIANLPVDTLSSIVATTTGGDWGKDASQDNNSRKVYCIRGADIPEVNNGNRGRMPVRYIQSQSFLLKHLVDGDLVVEISGGSPTQSTGRMAYISQALLGRYEGKMVCTNFCKTIKPKADYNMLLYHHWQYLYSKGVFFSYENGTTGIKNLDLTGVLSTEIIHMPAHDTISKFNSVCYHIFSQIYANSEQNEKLCALRDILLTKLMSGEIDVSNVAI